MSDGGRRRPLRIVYFLLGLVMLLLGFVGAILPIMPTTVFLILAAGCFARSSPRLEAKILEHPRFGPPVKAWREEGAIPRTAKYLALGGMTIGYLVFLATITTSWWMAVPVGLGIMCCGLYVATRPEPSGRVAGKGLTGPTETPGRGTRPLE